MMTIENILANLGYDYDVNCGDYKIFAEDETEAEEILEYFLDNANEEDGYSYDNWNGESYIVLTVADDCETDGWYTIYINY